MMFKRKGEYTIANIKLQLDAEDIQGLDAAGPWFADMHSNNPVFYRTHGIKGKEFRESLGAFILGADFGVYVEFADPQQPLNYRKANLRVSTKSGVRQKGPIRK
jgi:hypothetical protein